MKMKAEHFQYLKDALTPIVESLPFEVYQAQSLSPKRYRWDLLWRAKLSQFICDELYPYLNDDHIDTALRRITRDTVINPKECKK